MFEKKTPILYLTKAEAFLYDGVIAAAPLAMTWDGKHLGELIQLVKQHTKDGEWRLLVGNDYSYLLTHSLSKEQVNGAFIKQELAGRVPEDIMDDNYAWKIIAATQHQPLITVQSMVLPGAFLQAVQTACKDQRVSVQGISSLPLVLAQETKTFSAPHVLSWVDAEHVWCVSYHGAIYYCEPCSGDQDMGLQRVIRVAQTRYSLVTKTIISNQDLPENIASHLLPDQKILKHVFSSIGGMIQQYGTSDSLLWLHPGVKQKVVEVVATPLSVSVSASSAPPPAKSSQRLYILLGVLMVLLLITVWYAYTAL